MKDQQEFDTNDGSQVDMTNTIEALWKNSRSLDVEEKRALKSKLCEIDYPIMSSMSSCLL